MKNKFEFRKNKGITLLALIITIIVMLILAGVTISMTLGEDGVIAQARKAQIETEKKTLLEQLLTLAEYDNTGKIKVMKTSKNAKEYFKDDVVNSYGISLQERIITIKAKSGEYSYLITNNEIKLIEGTIPVQLAEGDIVKFDSDLNGEDEEWIVLYKNENNIEIISTKVMGSLTLGAYDSWVNWDEVYDKANIDGENGLTKDEKAIYSYNNSIVTLSEYCKSLIKAENIGVRNFGVKPRTDEEDNEMIEKLSTYDSWNEENKTIWNNIYKNKIKVNYKSNEEFKKLVGFNNSYRNIQNIDGTTTSMYWYAGFYNVLNTNNGRTDFYLSKSDGTIISSLFMFDSTGKQSTPSNEYTAYVRPVIKLEF